MAIASVEVSMTVRGIGMAVVGAIQRAAITSVEVPMAVRGIGMTVVGAIQRAAITPVEVPMAVRSIRVVGAIVVAATGAIESAVAATVMAHATCISSGELTVQR